MAAIDFPASPANGDVFGTFTYDSSLPGWRKTPELAAGLPAGTIVQWPGATAPANWLIADGSAVSRTTYPSLFAAIGVQYGSGDGTTTFNLPNLKGRVAVGRDSSQSEFDTPGKTGGAKTHTLTTAEMPSHTHTQDAHSHGITDPTHTHSLGGSLVSSFLGYGQNSPINGNATNPSSGGVGSSSTGITINNATATNQNTGGGGAHNNLQPYIVLNYIIKVSAGITSGDSELATRVGSAELEIDTLQTTGYRLVQTLNITSTTTFSKASYPWLRAIKVKLVGGGGGGGSTVAPGTSTNASGNGGGGGCYAEKFITDIASLSSSVTVTVGAGGTGGTAATNNAGTGGTSSFGSLCSASGGSPGLYGTQSSAVGFTVPTDSFTSRGGTTGVGDLVIPGGQGGLGFMQGGNSNAMGGAGGSSMLAGSIATPAYPGSGGYSRNGPTGQNYGGGGGGGSSLQAAGSTTGGAGAPGIVILELYA